MIQPVAALFALAACAAALVLPEPDAGHPQPQQQLELQQLLPSQQQSLRGSDVAAPGQQQQQHDSSRWPLFEEWIAGPARAAFDQAVDEIESLSGDLRDELTHAIVDGGSHPLKDEFSIQTRPDDDQGHNHTIYQFISHSNYTTKFTEYVDKYPAIVGLLNSTTAGNHTLFVPTNDAFDHVPDDLSREFVESLLYYHIVKGDYSAKDLLTTYTLPTTLKEEKLGDEVQRLRVSFNRRGLMLNFRCQITEVGIVSTNGMIHAVDSLLIPPPFASTIINFVPQYFSTLLLAYEKTNFRDFITSVRYTGITLFLPTNSAWAFLGPKANLFLFNTKQGLGYLKALLQYQLCPDVVKYTDATYDNREYDDAEAKMGYELKHYNLPTLLRNATLGVDIARYLGYALVSVNGHAQVIVKDAVAKNGVIQGINHVLIPPHKHSSSAGQSPMEEITGEIDVEDLKARLDPYLE